MYCNTAFPKRRGTDEPHLGSANARFMLVSGYFSHRSLLDRRNGWRRWRKEKDWVLFASLVIFLTIVYKYDLHHCSDDVKSIVLRCIAGFTEHATILGVCKKFKAQLEKVKFEKA